MLDRAVDFLFRDLSRDQVSAVLRVGWRVGVMIHIAFACGWLSMFGLSGFAQAEEISGLKSQVAQLSAQFQKDQATEAVAALELQVRALDQEIFQIEARLAELGRLGQTADQLYSSRLSTLRSDKAATERKLEQAMQNPALDLPGPSS